MAQKDSELYAVLDGMQTRGERITVTAFIAAGGGGRIRLAAVLKSWRKQNPDGDAGTQPVLPFGIQSALDTFNHRLQCNRKARTCGEVRCLTIVLATTRPKGATGAPTLELGSRRAHPGGGRGLRNRRRPAGTCPGCTYSGSRAICRVRCRIEGDTWLFGGRPRARWITAPSPSASQHRAGAERRELNHEPARRLRRRNTSSWTCLSVLRRS